jgi:hypothetical protein
VGEVRAVWPFLHPAGRNECKRRLSMFLIIALVLLVLWALGFFAFHVAGGLIHLLLIIAIVVGLVHLFQGRRAA